MGAKTTNLRCCPVGYSFGFALQGDKLFFATTENKILHYDKALDLWLTYSLVDAERGIMEMYTSGIRFNIEDIDSSMKYEIKKRLGSPQVVFWFKQFL